MPSRKKAIRISKRAKRRLRLPRAIRSVHGRSFRQIRLCIRRKYPIIQHEHLALVQAHFLDPNRPLVFQSRFYIQTPLDVRLVLGEVFQVLGDVVRPLRVGECGCRTEGKEGRREREEAREMHGDAV